MLKLQVRSYGEFMGMKVQSMSGRHMKQRGQQVNNTNINYLILLTIILLLTPAHK
jgi:hypothetical protein